MREHYYEERYNFSPNGKMFASGSKDKSIKLWDVETHREIVTLHGHSGPINSVNFSPDGKMFASGSKDKTIKLWDVATHSEITTLRGHSEPVRSVNFNPDGKMLASGSSDGEIRFWNLDLDDLLVRGCECLQGYLKTNPDVKPEDRALCDDILGKNYMD